MSNLGAILSEHGDCCAHCDLRRHSSPTCYVCEPCWILISPIVERLAMPARRNKEIT